MRTTSAGGGGQLMMSHAAGAGRGVAGGSHDTQTTTQNMLLSDVPVQVPTCVLHTTYCTALHCTALSCTLRYSTPPDRHAMQAGCCVSPPLTLHGTLSLSCRPTLSRTPPPPPPYGRGPATTARDWSERSVGPAQATAQLYT
jgi:hypothetical protein